MKLPIPTQGGQLLPTPPSGYLKKCRLLSKLQKSSKAACTFKGAQTKQAIASSASRSPHETFSSNVGWTFIPTQVQAASRKERVRTAHNLHLGFKVCAARRRSVWQATHTVGGDAGCGLLRTQATLALRQEVFSKP